MIVRLLILISLIAVAGGCGGVQGVPYVEPGRSDENAHLKAESPAAVFLIDDLNCKGSSFELTPGSHRVTFACSEQIGNTVYYSINNFTVVFVAESGKNYNVEAERVGMSWRACISDVFRKHAIAWPER